MLTDEVRLVLTASNLASEQINAVVTSLEEMAQRASLTDTSLERLGTQVLSLDASYQRVVASAASFASVQERVASGALADEAALRAQASALGSLESAMASYQTRMATAQTGLALPAYATPEAQARALELNQTQLSAAGSAVSQAQLGVQEDQFARQRAQFQTLIDETNRTVRAPIAAGETAGRAGGMAEAAGGGALGGLAGGLGTSVLYSAGFAAMYGLGQQLTAAVQTGMQEAVNQTATGLSAGQNAAVTRGIGQIAGGGTQLYSQLQLAQLAYTFASAGLTDPNQILQSVRLSAQAGTGLGLADPQAFAQGLVISEQAYPRQNVGALAATMRALVQYGQGTPEQLAPGLATSAGLASGMGIAPSQLAALLAFRSLQAPTPGQAGTDVNQLLTELLRPTAAGAQAEFRALGLGWGPQAIQGAGGIIPYIEQIISRTGALGPEQQTAILRGMFQQQAFDVVQQAATNPAQLARLGQQFTGAVGAGAGGVAQAAAGVLGTPAGQYEQAVREFENSLQDLAKTALPGATAAIKGLNDALHLVGDSPFWKTITDTLATGGRHTVSQAQTNTQSWINEHLSWIPGQGVGETQLDRIFGITPPTDRAAPTRLVPAQLAQLRGMSSAELETLAARNPQIVQDFLRQSGAAGPEPTRVSPVGGTADVYGGPAAPGTRLAEGPRRAPGQPGYTAADRAAAERALAISQRGQLNRGETQAALQHLDPLERTLRLAEERGEEGAAQAALAQIQQYLSAHAAEIYPGIPDPQTQAQLTYEHLATQEQRAFRSATTLRAATGPVLQREPALGLGDPRAGFGAVVTRVSGDVRQDEQTRHLQELVAQQRDTITTLKRELTTETDSNRQLRQIVSELQALSRQGRQAAAATARGVPAHTGAARVL